MRAGLDYFPLSVHFFEDEKIQQLSSRFGAKGELIAIKLLSRIYEVGGYWTKWDKDAAYLFAKSNFPGKGGGVSGSLVNCVCHELVKRGFFDKGIFNSFGVLTSHGIQERYLSACDRRKQVEMIEEYLLIDPQSYKNICVVSLSQPILSQKEEKVVFQGEKTDFQRKNVYIFAQSKRKEKESKVTKRKEIKKEKKDEKPKPKADTFFPNDEKLDQAFKDYIAMRKEIKKPMTERAVHLAITKLDKLSGGDNDKKIAILEQSIFNSWQGLFDITGNRKQASQWVDWDSL